MIPFTTEVILYIVYGYRHMESKYKAVHGGAAPHSGNWLLWGGGEETGGYERGFNYVFLVFYFFPSRIRLKVPQYL